MYKGSSSQPPAAGDKHVRDVFAPGSQACQQVTQDPLAYDRLMTKALRNQPFPVQLNTFGHLHHFFEQTLTGLIATIARLH
jgi:hypothetical protein